MKPGDKVYFYDEFGQKRLGEITRIIPKGEASKNEPMISIKAASSLNFGWYVRAFADVTKA